VSDQNPAPGWYPAPHANNEQDLDMMAFSRSSLAEQLAFEGFQQTEIDYGLASVGY
jgi:hypothetical protein